MTTDARRSLAAAGTLSLLALGWAGNAWAQAESDFDEQGRPVHYDAHASCDSKVLPRTHRIVGRVPGRDKECYWVRSGEVVDIVADPSRPALPDYLQLGPRTTPATALSLAHSRYGAALGYTNNLRREAVAAFTASLTECGADVGCVVRAYGELQSKQAGFNADDLEAAGDLGTDIAKIQAHFRLGSDWPRNTRNRP